MNRLALWAILLVGIDRAQALIASNVTRTNELEAGVTYEDSDNSGKKLVCYYGSWAVYRPGNGKFPVEEIDPFLCTHIIYGFTGLSHDHRIRPLDPYNDLKENWGKGAFLRFTGLKKINPKLKTLVAIGGWNEGSVKYSNMAANPEARRTFVTSVVEFLQKYDFDGLDFDWEYPGSRGGTPQDKQNFVSILRELKEEFKPHGFLLTAAVSAGKANADLAYDIPKVSQYLDIINVMCYDYHGGWETRTGHNAPLYARPDEHGGERQLNVNYSINYWISKGAPREKIVLGMGTYGRSFTLSRAENHGFNADAPQKGRDGPYTREGGSLGYNELCEMKLRNKNIVDVWDPHHLSPYAYWERQWVGYDDIESITLKAKYAKAMGLGGGMIWSLETDDFRGVCGDGKYPLLNAIKRVLAHPDVPSIPLPNEREETTTTSSSGSSSIRPTEPTTSRRPTNPTETTTKRPTTTTRRPITTTTSTTQRPREETTATSSSSSSTTTQSSPSSSPSYTTSKWWPYPPSTWWPLPSSSSKAGSTAWWGQSTTPSVLNSVDNSKKVDSAINSIETEDIPFKSIPVTSTEASTTTSMSPSTTTTKTAEDKKDQFKCREAGLYRHPDNCLAFVRCLSTRVEGAFQVFHHECPDKTVFNNETKLCDWVENVPECLRHVPEHYLRGLQLPSR